MPTEGVLYHTGFLMAERLYRGNVHKVAWAMWEAHQRGEVHLVQRKLRDYVYEYWAYPRRGAYVGD